MQTPNVHTPFDDAAIEALSSDEALGRTAVEVRRELDEQARETTPTKGVPTAGAERAQAARELIEVLEPFVDGLNGWLADRYPSEAYTDNQVRFVSTLGGKIIAKHVDLNAEENREEILLIGFLLTTGVKKGISIYKIERDRRLSSPEPERDGRNEADRPDSEYVKG